MINKVIRRKPKQPRVFAFIDNQNLNLGVQKFGWKMNWRVLREFLRDDYGVEQAFMFIGYMQEHEDLYKQMYDAGYNVILKPTVGMFDDAKTKEDSGNAPKGNVDTDLVLEVMKQWQNYDKAIIISGDGDFYGLIEHLEQKKKLAHVMVPNWRYSTLLQDFDKYIIRLDEHKNKLRYRDYKNKSAQPKNPRQTKKADNLQK